jgi:hypothetical protein
MNIYRKKLCQFVNLLIRKVCDKFIKLLFSCSKPSDQVILDYDYTFTTPYCGSDDLVLKPETV